MQTHSKIDQRLQKKRQVGLQVLPLDTEALSEDFLMKADLNAIAQSAQPKKLIQSLPVQVVYLSLKEGGAEALEEWMPLLSVDQTQRILDREIWSENSDSVSYLDQSKLAEWLLPLAASDPKKLAARFAAMDYELQMAFLAGKIDVLSLEEYETLDNLSQEGFQALPGNKTYYRIKADVELIDQLIQSWLDYDLEQALYTVVQSQVHMPLENEELARQFAAARLEEDGYVTAAEGSELFYLSLKTEEAKQIYHGCSHLGEDKSGLAAGSLSFMEYTVAQAIAAGKWNAQEGIALQSQLLYLANALCSAIEIEPGDVKALKEVLNYIKSYVSLGLEFSGARGAGEKDYVNTLKQTTVQDLFRTGLKVIRAFQMEVGEVLSSSNVFGKQEVEDWLVQLQNCRFAVLHAKLEEHVDRVSFGFIEVLKGFYNRFPLAPSRWQEKKLYFKPIDSIHQLKAAESAVHRMIAEESRDLKS